MAEDTRELPEKLALLEYTAIQDKLKYSVEDLYRVETLFPVAIGAFYIWLTKEGRTLALAERFIFIIPIMIAAFGLFRHLARMRYIALLESYLQEVEKAHLAPLGLGWETFYACKKMGTLQIRYQQLRIATWILLIVVTTLISISLWS